MKIFVLNGFITSLFIALLFYIQDLQLPVVVFLCLGYGLLMTLVSSFFVMGTISSGELNDVLKKQSVLKKQILLEKAKMEAVLKNLGEAVIIFDGEFNIIEANPKARKMLFTREDQDNLKDFHPKFWRGLKEIIEQSLRFHMVCSKSIQIGREDKSYKEVLTAPLTEDWGLITVQDHLHHETVHEMGRDFVANASHELRTPITIIKGFAEMLRDIPEISAAMLQDITEKIVRNCLRMNLLVKNLLTLADLEYLPKARLQQCDLLPLVENCKESLCAVYPNISITIENKSPNLSLQADPDLLELAIMNLLENGVKYSVNPAELSVKLEKLETGIHLYISDKGVGIPSKDLPHIFDRFYTVDKARSRKLGGAGLGLSIVKSIIRKHQGEIKATSKDKKGTTFELAFTESEKSSQALS